MLDKKACNSEYSIEVTFFFNFKFLCKVSPRPNVHPLKFNPKPIPF